MCMNEARAHLEGGVQVGAHALDCLANGLICRMEFICKALTFYANIFILPFQWHLYILCGWCGSSLFYGEAQP